MAKFLPVYNFPLRNTQSKALFISAPGVHTFTPRKTAPNQISINIVQESSCYICAICPYTVHAANVTAE